jgi:integrase
MAVTKNEKRTLTDRLLKSLKPALAGKRDDFWDTVVPGFGVQVTERGHRSYILIARYPGKSDPTRRKIGDYGALTLEQARERARAWLEMIRKGVDPALEEQRHRQSEMRRQENSFACVADAFIAEKLPCERKGREVERDIRRELIPIWGKRPITDIADIDVLSLIKAKKRTAPAQARNLFGIVKRLLKWAVDQRCYDLKMSPVADLKPTTVVGDKVTGDRILSDQEVFALWRAAARIPYPHGPVYQLLLLTGLRLNEVADAAWPEFDPAERLWTIPATRMKGKNGKARPHVVPITDEIGRVLQKLPRFKKGSHLFSTTFGASPVWISDKVKKRVDERMLRTLRALARARGDDPAGVVLQPWKNHDIRRTVRSGLSRLKISEEAREAVLAHARPGIKGTYDKYDYLDEKREALELWAGRLRTITQPPRPAPRPLSNVVSIAAARA